MKYNIIKSKGTGDFKTSSVFFNLKIEDKSLHFFYSKSYIDEEVIHACFSYILTSKIADDWFEGKADIYRYLDVFLVLKQDWYRSFGETPTQHSPKINGLLYKTFREAKASVKKDIKKLLKEKLKEKNNEKY